MTTEHTTKTTQGDSSQGTHNRDVVRAYLEGLDRRIHSCQASCEKMEETLEALPWKDLKEMQEQIAAQLEKKYISRVDLQHTLYEDSLKKAKKRIKCQLFIGALTLPFLSLALLWGLACLMGALK